MQQLSLRCPKPIKVSHVITGLHVGGAEAMLYKLLAAIDTQVVTSEVVALLPGGEYAERIRALAIPVHDLGMQRGVPGPQALWRLNHRLRSSAPAIVQTWMYHADLLGALATRGMHNTKLAWNIRHSNLVRDLNGPLTRWIVRLCAYLSHWMPDAIVCNSVTAKQIHINLGYAADKFVVIPNGFDTVEFSPDDQARVLFRAELGLASTTPLIGLIARFHPQKDHETFFKAVGKLHRTHPEAQFVLCGADISWDNEQLSSWVNEADVSKVTHLLGQRNDMPLVMRGLDMLCSSSSGEGFPNVIGEAMACAVPCVVTDVGDSSLVVDDTGLVVPPAQPQALAAALGQMLDIEPSRRSQLGFQARQRIIEEFSIERIAAQYVNLYLSLINSS